MFFLREDSLVKHINFLHTLGIAGVSHHSLLFSKTAVVPLVPGTNEAERLVFALPPVLVACVECMIFFSSLGITMPTSWDMLV